MMVKDIFLGWEKLRLLYNAVLIVVFIFLVISAYFNIEFEIQGKSIIGLFIKSIILAFIANILYMAGPIVESYLSWLGTRYKYLRHILFSLGLLLSIAIEGVYVILELTPD